MRKMGQLFLASVAIFGLAWVPAASAGTKYAANLVPTSLTAPNLSKKSKVTVKDNGVVTVILKGVQDSGGRVTTDRSWSGISPTITGDEYFVILKATFVADGTPFQISVPVELKNGKGAATISVAALFAMVPPGVVKSVEATGADVYGPLGADKAADCEAAIFASLGIILAPDPDTNPNPCLGGTKIGVAGILVP
jgi:hypothetical protein